jgi:hypothetical protein
MGAWEYFLLIYFASQVSLCLGYFLRGWADDLAREGESDGQTESSSA